MNNIKPLGSRVLVMRSKPEQKAGTIMLLDSSKTKENIGVVTAIGPEVREIAVNDRVLFSPYEGTPVANEDNDDEYFIFFAKHILAVVS